MRIRQVAFMRGCLAAREYGDNQPQQSPDAAREINVHRVPRAEYQ